MGITQSQLAKTLGISLQLIAAYEAGTRKIPASILQRQIEQIGLMPRSRQQFITEMLEALIKQQQSA